MQSIRLEEFGSPLVLKLREIEPSKLRPDEVRVEVSAAAVNPSDAKNIQGAMAQTTLPRTPGRDFAGVVVEGPSHLVGLEVWGTGGDQGFTRDGTHAEFVTLPVAAVRPKPRRLTMAEAAASGLGFVTAWSALIDAAHLLPGETVAITGAAGAVGSAAVQLAKWKGAFALALIRDGSQEVAARQAGADVIINLAEQPLLESVLAATAGRGADVVFDVVSGPLFEPGLNALALGGRFAAIVAQGDGRVSFSLRDFYHRQLHLIGVDTLKLSAVDSAQILELLAPGFESGALRPPQSIESYPLAEAAQAYESILSGNSAKIVLVPKLSGP